MKVLKKVASVLVAISVVGLLAYIKRQGDKHYIISQVLNNMSGYDY